LALALACASFVTVSCEDDDGAEEDHGGEAPAVCQEITDVCHDADMGSGMAYDCHEQAHENDAAQCEMIHDACIAFCTGGSTGDDSGTDSGSTG